MGYLVNLRKALVISLVFHAVFFLFLPRLAISSLSARLDKLEVSYSQLQALSAVLQPRLQDIRTPAEIKKNFRGSINMLKKDMQPVDAQELKEASHYFKPDEAREKRPLTAQQFSAQKKITVPPVKSEKMKNPVYNNYYQVVREKIRHRAYTNYSRYETGEVYLTFIVTSDGNLQGVKLMEEKTRADNYLREVALKSIRDSAPFPAFPANLLFPELSFNVVIAFEVSN
jgi:hypothetical protein